MATVCIFGDSIAWGANDSEGGGWVNRLQKYYLSQSLEVDKDVDIHNLGIPGDNTEDLLKRFDVELLARLADVDNVVIFAIGINDSQFVISKNDNRVSQDDFRANLRTLIEKANKHTNHIIFIGLTETDESKTNPIPWNTDKNYTNDDIQKYDDIIQDVAKELGAEYISMKNVVELDELSDGLHPNASGHTKIFEVVKDKIDL